MNEEAKLREQVGTDPGFIVPEGYFEQLYARMPEKLPEHKPVAPVKMTLWEKVKPYVYLAAMFAGIWCMVKMFHIASSQDISLENPPAEIVAAVNTQPVSVEEMVPDYAINDFELEQEVSSEYSSFEELSEELDYELKPEYASMKVNVEMPAAEAQPTEVAQQTGK